MRRHRRPRPELEWSRPERRPRQPLSGPLIIVAGFAGLVAAGALLLMSPFAVANGASPSARVAIFTSVSAVCVTGLVVVDTGTYWNAFGQGVILALMQLGGLGFMTGSTLLLLLIGRRITLRSRLLAREALGAPPLGNVVTLVRRVTLFTLAAESAGAALLFLRFVTEHPPRRALWLAVFHAVSAFTNGSFDLFGGYRSLTPFQTDAAVLLPVAALILIGGISFSVVADLVRSRAFGRLTLDSKIVLLTSLALLTLATAFILAAEWSNPETLGPLSLRDKLLNAFFHAVVPRTAGFTSVNVAAMREHTLVFTIPLMFIGGASGSMAGGIKVGTFSVLLVAIISTLKGRTEVVAFRREIPAGQVNQALAVALLSVALVFAAALVLTVTEAPTFLILLFETTSAFGTVGLSTGITPGLSPAGQLALAAVMFVGRLGPLTLGLALTQRQQPVGYRFAPEEVKIG